jgi:hypothetical protein
VSGQAIWIPAASVRALIEADGGFLLDVRRGLCHSLNQVGAAAWSALDRSGGLTLAELADVFRVEHHITAPTLDEDLAAFLQDLRAKRVVCCVSRKRPRASATTIGAIETPAASTSTTPSATAPDHATPLTLIHRSACTASSFVFLMLCDLALRVGGFPLLYLIVSRWPAFRRSSLSDANDADQLYDTVERAAAWYYKQTWCLPRSAAAALLLRSHGIDGRVIVGCRRIPLSVHAWIEVNGRAVRSDRPLRRIYRIVDVL